MRVFVTGATGFIGSAIVRELLDMGHEVVGLARSDQGAAAVAAADAAVHRGDLEDLDSLRRGAAGADGVIHTAFNHDFTVSRVDAATTDRRAVEAMAEALGSSDRPLVITSGTGGLAPGRLATEDTPIDLGGDPMGRYGVEEMAVTFGGRGVRTSVVRLPPPSTAAATTASSRSSLTLRAARASQPIRATVQIAGPPSTGSTPHISSGWPWNRRPTARGCTV